MSKLIPQSWEQIEAEAMGLHRDALKYPEGSARRGDLIQEAVALVLEWRNEQGTANTLRDGLKNPESSTSSNGTTEREENAEGLEG